MSWRMGRSKEWHRGYWDGFSGLPPASADAEYILGHLDGEEKARSDRQQARREIRGHATKAPDLSVFAKHKDAVAAAARAYNAAQRAYSLIEKKNLSKHPATKEATAAAHRRYMDTAAAYNEAVAAQAQYLRTGR
jgi:hypothetical protein